MKLLYRQFDKNGSGHATLIPEDAEDMWHCYNLIEDGDLLKASTIRKVTSESSTGSTSSQRFHTVLKIAIETINYDTHSGTLHVKGRNTEENPHVKLGAYHTLDLDLNRKFTLIKECWDAVHIERLDMACDPAQRADVAAVVMHEGLGHVCLITPNMTLVRAKIDQTIPRKRKGMTNQHDKGMARFYESLAQALLRHVDLESIKCVLIASPGFLREQFMSHLMQQAQKDSNKLLLDNKHKFLLVHSSNGFKHALNEILQDPNVQVKLSDTKASGEIKALETFFSLLQTEPGKAYYGQSHVLKAHEAQAIETLLICDSLFRSKDISLRKKMVQLVEDVKESGGCVKLFSSLHLSGEQLQQLSGLAAILRFPMPEIEEDVEMSDTDDQDDQIDKLKNEDTNTYRYNSNTAVG